MYDVQCVQIYVTTPKNYNTGFFTVHYPMQTRSSHLCQYTVRSSVIIDVNNIAQSLAATPQVCMVDR